MCVYSKIFIKAVGYLEWGTKMYIFILFWWIICCVDSANINDCSVESTKVSRFFTYNNLIKGILSRDFVDRQMNLIGRNQVINISTVFLFFFKVTFLFNIY